MKRMIIEKEYFDDEETFWQRAMTVDVLVLDDLGKGSQDSTGFGVRVIDELVRGRNAAKLVTFLTTNMRPDTRLAQELKASTMHSLKEHVLPIEVRGEDQRHESGEMMNELLLNS